MKSMLIFLSAVFALLGVSLVAFGTASALLEPEEVAKKVIAKAGRAAVEKATDRAVQRVFTRQDNRDAYAERLLVLTNQFRARNGLRPVQFDPTLQRAAQERTNAGYSHYIQGQGPMAGARSRGFKGRSAGENIAWGQPSPESAVNAWINSPGHRRNMLGNWQVCGMAKADGTNRWIQIFGNY